MIGFDTRIMPQQAVSSFERNNYPTVSDGDVHKGGMERMAEPRTVQRIGDVAGRRIVEHRGMNGIGDVPAGGGKAG